MLVITSFFTVLASATAFKTFHVSAVSEPDSKSESSPALTLKDSRARTRLRVSRAWDVNHEIGVCERPAKYRCHFDQKTNAAMASGFKRSTSTTSSLSQFSSAFTCELMFGSWNSEPCSGQTCKHRTVPLTR